MSNPAKDKGSKWELDLRRTLGAFFAGRYGLKPFKPHAEGRDDAGDIQGISPFVGQAKAYRSITDALRHGVEGAERQKVIANEMYGVAFVKRPGKAVGDGYAVMNIETFARVLLRLRRTEELAAMYVALRDEDDFLDNEVANDLSTPFPKASNV